VGEGVLIDTDVLIDYVKRRKELPDAIWYLPEVTLYEFIRGSREPKKAKELLEKDFIIIFHDNEIIENAAAVWRTLRSKGVPVEDRDLLIAATAISKGLPLLTGNVKHFARFKGFGLRFHGEET
jgi:predicted nucleic acid-binding protein